MSGWTVGDPEVEEAWGRATLQMEEMLEGVATTLRSTGDHYQWTPKPGSPAANDLADPQLGEREGIQTPLHWGYVACHLRLVACCDYLESLATLLGSWPPHMWGPSSVARSAIESAARAYWMLDPDIDRTTRAARMGAERLAESLWQYRLEGGRSDAPQKVKDLVMKAADDDEAIGLPVDRNASGWPRGIEGTPYPDLREAVPVVLPADEELATRSWRLLAAISHGSPLGIFRRATKTEAPDSPGNWIGRIHLTSAQVASITTGAASAVLVAFEQFAARYGWSPSSAWRRDTERLTAEINSVIRAHQPLGRE